VIGTGVIGSGWATRALSRGLEVVAWDPAPGAEHLLRKAIDRAWPSVRRLGLYPGARPDRITFMDRPEAVCEVADFIQESAPEDEQLKQQLHTRLDQIAPPHVIIASSSSGLLPTRIASGCSHPERIVIGHPFNPVYLLPLCEIVGGERTARSTIEEAALVYDYLDMYPLIVRHEIPGYLSDRLQEALWREILHLVNDGVATTGELDDAITYGPGLRWAAMGTNLTFHLAGGAGGMRHMLAQFGPALKLSWTKLKAPELTTELIEAMASGCETQAAGDSIEELERQRDDSLLAVMRALRASGVGAGKLMAEREARILAAAASDVAARWKTGAAVPCPLHLYRGVVEPDWVDRNGHMTDSAALTAFGCASDRLFRYIGIDETYRRGGHSYFTVETHLNYRSKASLGQRLRVTTRVLGSDSKRLHIFHAMYHDGEHGGSGLPVGERDKGYERGELLCTDEQMLLHVDTTTGHSTALLEGPAAALAAITQTHADMPIPPEASHLMTLPTRR